VVNINRVNIVPIAVQIWLEKQNVLLAIDISLLFRDCRYVCV